MGAGFDAIRNVIFLVFRISLNGATRAVIAVNGAQDVSGVPHAVDVTNLVAIEGGDGNLADAEALMMQLNDDLRVEMEIIGHVGEVDLLEGVKIIGPVSTMKLGEIQSESAVFKVGQDAVADVFISRHAALERAAVILHHARSEDGVSRAGDDRMVHAVQDLRRILAVAVQQHDRVEALFYEIAVPGLLIAAIAKVSRMPQHLKFGVIAERLQADGEFIGRVLTGVIENNHFLDIAPHLRLNTAQHLGQRGDRVIRDDENADPPAVVERRGEPGVALNGMARKGDGRHLRTSGCALLNSRRCRRPMSGKGMASCAIVSNRSLDLLRRRSSSAGGRGWECNGLPASQPLWDNAMYGLRRCRQARLRATKRPRLYRDLSSKRLGGAEARRTLAVPRAVAVSDLARNQGPV